MKVILALVLCSLLFISCSKHAVKVMPQIEGSWLSPISAPNCGSSFSIDSKSNGHYYQESVGLNHDGRAKIIDNTLYIDNYNMLTIVEIKDSIGIVPNYDSTLCFTQLNVEFDRIIKSSTGTIWYRSE